MPALSPTMTKGNLAKWRKKEGDKISAGDVIAGTITQLWRRCSPPTRLQRLRQTRLLLTSRLRTTVISPRFWSLLALRTSPLDRLHHLRLTSLSLTSSIAGHRRDCGEQGRHRCFRQLQGFRCSGSRSTRACPRGSSLARAFTCTRPGCCTHTCSRSCRVCCAHALLCKPGARTTTSPGIRTRTPVCQPSRTHGGRTARCASQPGAGHRPAGTHPRRGRDRAAGSQTTRYRAE